MDKIEKIKDWLAPYLREDKVRDERDKGFFHCAMLLNDFLDTLSEEPDKSLDEAAEEFANQDCVTFISRKKGFIAGAKWQKEQIEKTQLTACDKMTQEDYDRLKILIVETVQKEKRLPTLNDAIKYGMGLQKEQKEDEKMLI